jgi:hypothetical protein
MGKGESDQIPRPASRWWRQRGLLIAEVVGLALLTGGVLAALAPWSDFVRGLVGGALLGLGASVVLGSLFTTHDVWAQHYRDYRIWLSVSAGEKRAVLLSQTETTNAYYLGLLVRTLPVSETDIGNRVPPLRNFCSALGISFSREEYKLLESSGQTLEEAAKISKMVRQKAKHLAPPEWWCFFELGWLMGSLTHHLESSRPIRQIMDELSSLEDDRFLRQDERYAMVVSDLLMVLRSFDETASGKARQTIMAQVSEVLSKFPPPLDGESRDPKPFELASEWFWIDENGEVLPTSHVADYWLLARGPWDYEVSGADSAYRSRVTRRQIEWSCSTHPGADANSPCFDIQLVFDHTNGGTPVTEARLILMRMGDDGELEVRQP